MKKIKSIERFKTKNIKASYLIEEEKEDWQECTIRAFSYREMDIIFHTDEEIDVGSTVHLKVFTSGKSEYFTVNGILTWIEKKGNAFVGGIELSVILSETEWIQISSFVIQESLIE